MPYSQNKAITDCMFILVMSALRITSATIFKSGSKWSQTREVNIYKNFLLIFLLFFTSTTSEQGGDGVPSFTLPSLNNESCVD